jgi:hypothetical protein
MANNTNTMTNGNDYQQMEAQAKRNLQGMQEEHRRYCNHKNQNNRRTISIHEYNGYIQDKDKYSETTGYCTGCGAIFETESYSREEISTGIYMFNSMLHQIKLVASLSKEDVEQVAKTFDALDTLAKTANYYNNMIEKLGNGKGNGNNRNRGNGKGHIGVDAGMFGGGRGY